MKGRSSSETARMEYSCANNKAVEKAWCCVRERGPMILVNSVRICILGRWEWEEEGRNLHVHFKKRIQHKNALGLQIPLAKRYDLAHTRRHSIPTTRWRHRRLWRLFSICAPTRPAQQRREEGAAHLECIAPPSALGLVLLDPVQPRAVSVRGGFVAPVVC